MQHSLRQVFAMYVIVLSILVEHAAAIVLVPALVIVGVAVLAVVAVLVDAVVLVAILMQVKNI